MAGGSVVVWAATAAASAGAEICLYLFLCSRSSKKQHDPFVFWKNSSCLQRGGAQVEVAGGSVVVWAATAAASAGAEICLYLFLCSRSSKKQHDPFVFWKNSSCLQRGGAQVEVAGGSVVVWAATAAASAGAEIFSQLS